MKKRVVSILAVVLAFIMVFTTVASAQEPAKKTDSAKMAESLHTFDEAHPEYKDAWYEIMQAFEEVLNKVFSEAFENIQEKASKRIESKRSEHDVDSESAAEMDELLQTMTELINASFMQSVSDSFEAFDGLAEDGEVVFDDEESPALPEEEVKKEDLEKALDAYQAYKKSHPKFAEKGEAKLFGNLNKDIRDEFSAAFADAREELEEQFKEIFEKYKIPKEDQDAIVDMLDMMVEQINENFLEKLRENTAAGPLDLGPQSVFVSADGVMSINRPGDDDKWVVRVDSADRFVIADGLDSIIMRHYANGEEVRPLHMVDDEEDAFVEYTELVLSNADEIFYVTGIARVPEEAAQIREAVMSFQVLKYGTKKALTDAEQEYSVEKLDEIRYCVEKDGASVRVSHLSGGDILGTLEKGDQVHVTGRVLRYGEETDWLQVEYEGEFGYVWSSHFAAFEP